MERISSYGEKNLIKQTEKILHSLFWEYKWESVKKNLTSPFVIARVLELGNPEQFRIFSELVGEETIKNFLREKGEILKFSDNF